MSDNRIEIMEDLGAIADGVILPFPQREYDNRLRKIRREMQENGIDMLYITSPESMYYVSGLNLNWYQTSSSSVWNSSKANGIAIHVDYDNFIMFQIPDEAQTVIGATCAKDARFIADQPGDEDMYMFGKKLLSAKPGLELPMDLIVQQLKKEGWLKGRIAMEMGSPRPPWIVGEMLKKRFLDAGCAEVVDGTSIVLKVRKIKSPLEMLFIEKASTLADIGHKAVCDGLHQGISELELQALYTRKMIEAGGEDMAIQGLIGFGKGRKWWVHSPASRKRLMVGDPLRVDLCGVYHRYHSDQGRWYSLGEPDKETYDEYAKGKLIMEIVKKIIKPNLLINDFFSEIKRFLNEEGIAGEQYWLGGYEMGIAFPPDWVGEFVYDSFVDAGEQRFEPGMVVNFETGFGVTDTLMFTETEARILGTTPWDMQIIDPDNLKNIKE